MPALPHIPNVIRIDLTFSAGTVFGGSRIFWQYVAPQNPSGAQLAALAASVSGSFNTTLCPQMTSNVSLTQVKCTDLQSNTAFIGVDNTPRQGTLAGGELPLSNAAMINLLIPTRYRGGKPRVYLPLGSDTQTNDGRHWLGSFITAVNNAYTTFTTDVQGFAGGINMGQQAVVHYYKGFQTNPSGSPWAPKNVPKVDPNAGNTQDYVSGHALNPVIGSQRRRLRSSS